MTSRVAFVPQLFDTAFDYSVLDMELMGRARRIGLFAQPTRRDEEACLAASSGSASLALPIAHSASSLRRQRHMVVLARVLVAEARVLLLDEPTSALDLSNQALVLDWMRRLAREDGLTIAFTTHHPHHAIAVTDEALLMLGPDHYLSGPVGEALERLKGVWDRGKPGRVTGFCPVAQGKSEGDALALRPGPRRPDARPVQKRHPVPRRSLATTR